MPDAGPMPDAPPPAKLMSDPPMLAFGSVTSSSSNHLDVMVENAGGVGTATLSSSVTGTDAALFTRTTDGCNSKTLGAGASCTVSVTFAPRSTGAKGATLTVGDGTAQVTVPLSGTALAPGALAFTGAAPTFATVAVGGSSMSTATVKNNGGSTITGLTTSLTGGSSGDFTISPDGCSGMELAANATCTMTLTFHPSAGGTRTSSLLVSGASGGSASTSLSGTGTVHLTVATTGTGTGTVTSTSPAGINCPPTCQADLPASSVTLSATPTSDSTFASWSTCPGTGGCTVTLDSPKTVSASFTLQTVCVDPVAGNDTTNRGSCASPFKTIHKAVTLVPPGGTVKLLPGVYSTASNNETFPIVVPPNVKLVGDEANKGAGGAPVSIQGTGGFPDLSNQASVVAKSNSIIAGLKVDTLNTANNAFLEAILLDGTTDAVTVRNCTLVTKNGTGIYITSSTNHQILGNVVQNSGWPLQVFEGGAKVEGNRFTLNQFGLVVTADIDLGGGQFSSAGGNTFSCNLNYDVTIEDGTLFAKNNFWDHSPPSRCTVCNRLADGVDFCTCNATLISDVASVTSAPCP